VRPENQWPRAGLLLFAGRRGCPAQTIILPNRAQYSSKENSSNPGRIGKNSGKGQMDVGKYGLTAVLVVALICVGAWALGMGSSPDPKPVLAPTCPSILPQGGASNGFAFSATDGNGDFAYGVIHFYPNGFRHNAAILIDQGNSPSTDPVTLFDIDVQAGCAPADGSQPATLTLTKDGAPAAILHFSSPASDPSAAFAVTFAPSSSGNPQNPISAFTGAQSSMTGNAYLIGNQ
jgi:hypothetical protein